MRSDSQSANLDFLRAVAVLAVYICHLAVWFGVGSHNFSFESLGRLGVLFFFAHTALVLMLSMERTRLTAAQFYVRRIFRIYPLSLILVLLIAVGKLNAPNWFPTPHLSATVILSNLALIQNITVTPSIVVPLWSLPFEIQMYALLPFLFLVAVRHKSGGVLLCIGVSIVAFSMFGAAGFPRLAVLISFFPCFLSGVLAFTLQGGVSKMRPGWIFAVLIVALCGAMFLLPSFANNIGANWAACLVTGLLIPAFREIRNRWVRGASHTIAKYSYGIYLSHLPAIWIGQHASQHLAIRLAVIAALSVALPLLAYHWIEAPMIGVGKRLTARAQQTHVCDVVPPPAPALTVIENA